MGLGEDRCVDSIKASKNVIVLACASDNTIIFVNRSTMELLKIDNTPVVLKGVEKFTYIKDFDEEEVTGANTEDTLLFESDFIKVLDREGHVVAFVTTYDPVDNRYKINYIELIAHDKADGNGLNAYVTRSS